METEVDAFLTKSAKQEPFLWKLYQDTKVFMKVGYPKIIPLVFHWAVIKYVFRKGKCDRSVTNCGVQQLLSNAYLPEAYTRFQPSFQKEKKWWHFLLAIPMTIPIGTMVTISSTNVKPLLFLILPRNFMRFTSLEIMFQIVWFYYFDQIISGYKS